jgi:hypothetical protein
VKELSRNWTRSLADVVLRMLGWECRHHGPKASFSVSAREIQLALLRRLPKDDP